MKRCGRNPVVIERCSEWKCRQTRCETIRQRKRDNLISRSTCLSNVLACLSMCVFGRHVLVCGKQSPWQVLIQNSSLPSDNIQEKTQVLNTSWSSFWISLCCTYNGWHVRRGLFRSKCEILAVPNQVLADDRAALMSECRETGAWKQIWAVASVFNGLMVIVHHKNRVLDLAKMRRHA